LKNYEIAETFGLHRTTLRNWAKSENEGREFLLYILKHLPEEYVQNMKNNFKNEKKHQELLVEKL
jgi:hypothetical protein